MEVPRPSGRKPFDCALCDARFDTAEDETTHDMLVHGMPRSKLSFEESVARGHIDRGPEPTIRLGTLRKKQQREEETDTPPVCYQEEAQEAHSPPKQLAESATLLPRPPSHPDDLDDIFNAATQE